MTFCGNRVLVDRTKLRSQGWALMRYDHRVYTKRKKCQVTTETHRKKVT